MANTSSHPWTVNGVRLDTWAYNIEDKNGWVHVNTTRGTDVQVPGRHGTIWVPNKKRDPGQIILKMWVSHLDVDGNMVGTDKYANWRHNMDALINVFDSSYGLLDVRHTISDTDIRQAFCEVKAISDPAMFGDIFGSLTVSMDIPASFWQDVAYTEWATPSGTAAVGTHDMTSLSGGTAPMEDSQVVVYGPLTNPVITDDRTGHYVQLNDALATGDQWTLDNGLWTSKKGSNIAWTTGGTSVTSKTVSSGFFAPRLLGLAQGSPPRVRLGGTGAGASTQMRIRARKKFK